MFQQPFSAQSFTRDYLNINKLREMEEKVSISFIFIRVSE